MREIRTSGSEGGGNGTTEPPYPYHALPSGMNEVDRPAENRSVPGNDAG